MPTFAVIESPYASDDPVELARNIAYVRAAAADCFARGEVPFASHGFYTLPGILDDKVPEERVKGIKAGFDVARAFAYLHGTLVNSTEQFAFVRPFYTDRGWSGGMVEGLEDSVKKKHAYEKRSLGAEWSKKSDHLYSMHYDGRSLLHTESGRLVLV